MANNEANWDWIEALDALDEDGDKKPLTDLLRSDCELPKEVREWLADLIERGVPPPPNRPSTPAYRISDVSLLHLLAMNLFRKLRKQGVPEEAALEQARKESGLSESALRLSLEGKNASLRRDLSKKIKKKS